MNLNPLLETNLFQIPSGLPYFEKYFLFKFVYLKGLIFLNVDLDSLFVIRTREVRLNMEIKIDIPQDIILDKKRLKSVQHGILKAISKGP